MINSILNMMVNAFIGRFLKDRVQRGSVQAVKAYLQAVRFARLGTMGIFAAGAVSALFVVGLVLAIVGIVTLLPITPLAMSIAVLSFGVVLMFATGIPLIMAFNEKRWLKMSKSYELMDAVLTPFSGVMPPNPMNVVKQEAPETPAPTQAYVRTQDVFTPDYPNSHLAPQMS